MPAALYAVFGMAETPGKLPINIPVMEKDEEGQWKYGEELLYKRGFSAADSQGENASEKKRFRVKAQYS